MRKGQQPTQQMLVNNWRFCWTEEEKRRTNEGQKKSGKKKKK